MRHIKCKVAIKRKIHIFNFNNKHMVEKMNMHNFLAVLAKDQISFCDGLSSIICQSISNLQNQFLLKNQQWELCDFNETCNARSSTQNVQIN